MKFFFEVYDLTLILQLLIGSCSLVFVFENLEKNAKSYIKLVAHIAITFAFGTLLNYVLFQAVSVGKIANLLGVNYPLAWLIIIVLYLLIFGEIPITSRIIMGASLYVVIITMADLGHYGWGVFLELMPNNASYMFFALEYVFVLGFALLLKRFTIAKYTDIPLASAMFILTNSVVMTVILFINTRFMATYVTEANELYCMVVMMMYILTVTGYMMIWLHCKTQKKNVELEVENRLLSTDKQMLMISEQAIDDMKCLRHDIKNQYLIMQMMLEDNKYDELQAYFESMDLEKIMIRGPKFVESGNELVDSIINMEMMKAASNDVSIITKINLPQAIGIDKSDLCRILVNLLDNAIEAVIRYSAYAKPIDCQLSQNNDYLYVCIKNGLGNAENDEDILELATRKSNPELHGYGHRIIDRLVDKYRGYIRYSLEDGEFVAEVMLDTSSVS